MARYCVRVVLLSILFFAVTCGGPALAADRLQYNRDVRPILADKCFSCHGPDSASRQADLRLDQRQAAIDAGAISPGEPDDSELIARIFADDPDLLMPPAAAHKTLTSADMELLRRWIAEGAEYQVHWSFIPPQRPHCRPSSARIGSATRSIVSCWPAWKPSAWSPPPKRIGPP